MAIGEVARAFGMSPKQIRRLTDHGQIPAQRSAGGHRRYDLRAVRAALDATSVPGLGKVDLRVDVALALAGLDEAQVWRDVLPELDLADSPAARSTVAYAFTEMLNNAIDHSGGTTVRVRAWRNERRVAFIIADDGAGAFRRVREGFGLASDAEAVAEITKGKRTTAPEAHTGEGIFFTSKVVDEFRLEANGFVLVVDNRMADVAMGESDVVVGTTVSVELDPRGAREPGVVMREYSDDDHRFVRSRTVVKLFVHGAEFVSRSEAKRLLAGLDQFAEVEVDFTDVRSVGQGFVDELVRVWPNQHPGTSIVPTHMNEAVEFMLRRGLPVAAIPKASPS